MIPLLPMMPLVIAVGIFRSWLTLSKKWMDGVPNMLEAFYSIKQDTRNCAENDMESNVIDATNIFKPKVIDPETIEKPDPDCVYADKDGKLYFLHEVEYYFKGKLYSTLFWGEHGKDVSDKINAMASCCTIKQILGKEDLRGDNS